MGIYADAKQITPEESASHGSSCMRVSVPILSYSLLASDFDTWDCHCSTLEAKKMIGPRKQGLKDRIHRVATLTVRSRHVGFLQLSSFERLASIYGPIRVDETDTAVQSDVGHEIGQRARHGTEMQASVVQRSIYCT